MASKTIVKLGKASAVAAIEGEKEVYYKHGVWNQFELRATEEVKKAIMSSGYGADVSERDGVYYVSCPNNSDMW